jgi:hypothetical protein
MTSLGRLIPGHSCGNGPSAKVDRKHNVAQPRGRLFSWLARRGTYLERADARPAEATFGLVKCPPIAAISLRLEWSRPDRQL